MGIGSKGGSDAGASAEPGQGAAPVRSDAFLSRFPLSGSTMSPLRHLSSIRFSLANPLVDPFALRPTREVFPYSSNGYIKCRNDGKFDHREI